MGGCHGAEGVGETLVLYAENARVCGGSLHSLTLDAVNWLPLFCSPDTSLVDAQIESWHHWGRVGDSRSDSDIRCRHVVAQPSTSRGFTTLFINVHN